MHTDENKIFDKRNTFRNIKDGIISSEDYADYLSKLPDVSDKLFDPEESSSDSDELESKKRDEMQPEKKPARKKSKSKGK